MFKTQIGFFLSESFFKNLVHGFGFLMSFPTGGAIDQVRVKHASFVLGKLAVQIGGEPVVDFVVNRCHSSNPVRRERDEAVCATKRERGQEFRAARHSSGRVHFRCCDNLVLRSTAG